MPSFLRVVGQCVLVFSGFWVADALLGLLFYSGSDLTRVLFHPSNYDLGLRIIVGSLLIGGFLLIRFSSRRNQAARDELAQQKELYQTLVETSPEAILVHQNFQFLFVNQVSLDFLDIQEFSELKGLTILDFILPEHHAEVGQMAELVLAGESVPLLELKVRKPNGEIVDIQASSVRISWSGQPAILSVFQDITEQIDQRHQMAITGERLQLALDAAQDGVWDWDISSGKMVYNDSWAAMLGLTLEEIPANRDTWRDLVHRDDFLRAEAQLNRHLEGIVPSFEIEVRLRHKAGHYIWVLDRGKVVERDSQGQPLRMTGTHRNITARKEAEHALEVRNRVAEAFLTQETEALFPRILKVVSESLGASIGLFASLDAQGDLKALATTGQPDPQAPNMSPQMTFEPNHLPEVFEQVINQGQFVISNEPLELPGHFIPLKSILGVPISNRDTILGAIFMGNKAGGFLPADLAFLRSLAGYIAPLLNAHLNSEAKETQLRQVQKMEALGALAGGIAHDFNNILQAIMGFTSLALEDAGQEGNIPGDLKRVLKAARRGQELVQRIQLFSRRDEQKHMPLDIQTVVLETIDLLKPTFPATIEIRSHLDAQDARVFGDPGQVSQVVFNLATNAFHAMEPDGGVLEFNLYLCDGSRIREGCPEGPSGREMIAFSISDTGAGMSEEVKGRLFDPFFTTKDVGQGTGLGMSVVHGIVQAHLGEIQIESEIGKGTTVRVFLPRYVQDTPPEMTKVITQPGVEITGGRNIAILDDEEDITQIGKALLERLGHRVTPESNGHRLLEAVEKDPYLYDLVITDLTMPRITGLQLADRLEMIRSDLPIILITGISDQDGINLEQHPNIKGLIGKPFGGDSLRQEVSRILNVERVDSWPES